jgi:hypothetical protein
MKQYPSGPEEKGTHGPADPSPGPGEKRPVPKYGMQSKQERAPKQNTSNRTPVSVSESDAQRLYEDALKGK